MEKARTKNRSKKKQERVGRIVGGTAAPIVVWGGFLYVNCGDANRRFRELTPLGRHQENKKG